MTLHCSVLRTLAASALISVGLVSCTGSSRPDDKAFMNAIDSAAQNAPMVDEELIGGMLDQIPSPLEISVMIKQSGTHYNEKLLNAPDHESSYNTNFKKALNLGVYGTDLGYTNIYEQKMAGIRYLASIKGLAEDLGIGQFFDIETIGRLASNSSNLDSLLSLTTQNFNAINHHLQSENKSSLSVLLLVGGWIEALEITCQVASQDKGNAQLRETIGSQKIVLEQLVLLLTFYESDPQMAELSKEFNDLKSTFDAIKITYTYKESTMEIVNGVAVIKDNSTTTIDITDQDIDNIQQKVNSIRNKIIS